MQHAGRSRVQIRPVGPPLKLERARRLHLALESIHLVDVRLPAQPVDLDLPRVGHRVVGVQRLLEHQRRSLRGLICLCGRSRGPSTARATVAGVVLHTELQRQLAPDADPVAELEVVVPKRATQLVRRQRKGQMQLVTRHRRKRQLPLADACEPMLRPLLAVVPLCKPRKDDGHAAADGLARHELRALAQEDRRRLARGLPVGHMRALQVDGGLRRRRCHPRHHQSRRRPLEPQHTRDRKLVLQLSYIRHRTLPSRFPVYASRMDRETALTYWYGCAET